MQFLEDAQIGDKTELGRHTFTAEEIKSFATRFDPQRFHVSEEAAAQSHFGALCASGWHTVAVWMRLAIRTIQQREAEQRARSEAFGALGPSPGFRDLKWLKPVYVGDTISYAMQIADKRASQSLPGWGILTLLNTGTNQHEELVLSFVSTVFVERRPE